MSDLFTEMGRTAIGSRLRRLGEWMGDDVAALYEAYDVHLQPKWFPVFHLLSDGQPRGITAIAELIGHSHPSVSKMVREMSRTGLVSERRSKLDGRQNLVALTKKGMEEMEKMQPQLQDVGAAVDQAFEQTHQDLLRAIEEWEYLLKEKSLMRRTLEQKKLRESKSVRIVPYSPQYREAFFALNKQWIDTYFEMESEDKKYLEDPEGNILAQGGDILVALYDEQPVGVCALVRLPEEFPYDYELSKMAVDPEMRGKNIGYLLGQAIIDLARQKGGATIFLESNTILVPAINLYRKLGFEKVAQGASNYERSNIQMAMEL